MHVASSSLRPWPHSRVPLAEFDAAPASVFVCKHAWLPVVSTIFYLLFVYYGPKYMENRKYVHHSLNPADPRVYGWVVTRPSSSCDSPMLASCLGRLCRAFDLKVPLAVWNLCLALVSFMGAFRLGSHLLFLLTPGSGFGVRALLCR